MHKGNQRQYVESVLVGHRPYGLRCVCERIPYSTEDADEKVGKSLLFALLGFRDQRIKGEDRAFNGKSFGDEIGAVGMQIRELSDPLGDSFCGLQNGME